MSSGSHVAPNSLQEVIMYIQWLIQFTIYLANRKTALEVFTMFDGNLVLERSLKVACNLHENEAAVLFKGFLPFDTKHASA